MTDEVKAEKVYKTPSYTRKALMKYYYKNREELNKKRRERFLKNKNIVKEQQDLEKLNALGKGVK